MFFLASRVDRDEWVAAIHAAMARPTESLFQHSPPTPSSNHNHNLLGGKGNGNGNGGTTGSVADTSVLIMMYHIYDRPSTDTPSILINHLIVSLSTHITPHQHFQQPIAMYPSQQPIAMYPWYYRQQQHRRALVAPPPQTLSEASSLARARARTSLVVAATTTTV